MPIRYLTYLTLLCYFQRGESLGTVVSSFLGIHASHVLDSCWL